MSLIKPLIKKNRKNIFPDDGEDKHLVSTKYCLLFLGRNEKTYRIFAGHSLPLLEMPVAVGMGSVTASCSIAPGFISWSTNRPTRLTFFMFT